MKNCDFLHVNDEIT